MEEKTYVDDIDRSIYDIKNDEKDVYRIQEGLAPEIVTEISRKKKDPSWMEIFRLQSLQIYNRMKEPDWGPSLEGLDMEHIVTYVRPNTHMSGKWSDVPEEIKNTFELLGSPRRSKNHLPVWEPSMTQSWYIIMYGKRWQPRAWFIRIWRAP